jgi:hypothetical protein
MDLDHYQQQAALTDQYTDDDLYGEPVALLGLAGEVGTLLSEYKKHLRDGNAHEDFAQRMADDIGDSLWYLGKIARHRGLSLGTIARDNLVKTRQRWLHPRSGAVTPVDLFDADRPTSERLPRQFTIHFHVHEQGWAQRVRMELDGQVVGDPLSDKAYSDIGYRWHDAFHLSYAACLGWSPTFRTLIGRRRVSDPVVDQVEDGGRAKVIDEGIAALVFDYARRHHYLDGITALDDSLLKTIHSVTAGLEVHVRTPAEWEHAIISGFTVFRHLRRHNGGVVVGDLNARTLVYRPAGDCVRDAVTSAGSRHFGG